MKRTILAFVLILSVFLSAQVYGQTSSPIDLVLLLDTSSGMSSSYDNVNNYITGAFLTEYLRIGDTFHLISFSANPRLDAARRVTSAGDVETIIGRMFLQYPVERGANVGAAISYAEQYIVSLPNRPKKIVLVSTGGSDTNNLVSSAKTRLSSRNSTFDYIQVTPGQPLTNLPKSGRPAARSATAATGTGSGSTSATASSSSRTTGSGTTTAAGSTAGTGTTGAAAGTSSTTDTGRKQGTQSTTGTGSASTGTTSTSTGTGASSSSGTAAGTSTGTGTSSASGTGTRQDSTSTGTAGTGTGSAGTTTSTSSSSSTAGSASGSSSDAAKSGTSASTYPAGERKSEAGADWTTNLPLIIGIILFILLLLGLILLLSSRKLGSSPNRAMAQAASPRSSSSSSASSRTEERFADHSKDLNSFAATGSARRSTPYENKRSAAPVINPSGPLLLNLFVEDQNTAIGKRNIHSLKSGFGFSVGGGKADDFLIFLVPMPPAIGEIRREGSTLTFTPKKPKYFPDIGSNPVRDCINKTIRIVSDKNYEMRFRFEMYEDPLIALNRVLTQVKVPGI